jgi:hypothetical protein
VGESELPAAVTILVQFLLRLSTGLAAAMLVTPTRHVASGFFRNHSYVLLGINVLASLLLFQMNESGVERWTSILAAMAGYIASVMWLYEKPQMGQSAIAVIFCFSIFAAMASAGVLFLSELHHLWVAADICTSAAVLGSTIGAMFLGHWFLNAPGMRIEPLRWLVGGIGVAVLCRAVVCAIPLFVAIGAGASFTELTWALLAIRCFAGIVAPLVVAWMVWQTLRIPNTQSATGILYVGVIGVFLGELAALALWSGEMLPR